MRRSPIRLVAFPAAVVLLVAANGLLAQAQTLRECLQAASQNHPSVRQALSQAGASGFDAEAARWAWFPTISSELRVPLSQGQTVTGIEQPLWTGGRLSAQIALQEANERAALAGVEDTQTGILLQTAVTFYENLRQQSRLEIAASSLEDQRRLVDLIDRRVEAEASPKADATLAMARLQQTISEKIATQRALEAARFSLEQWTGITIRQLVPSSALRWERSLSVEDYVERAKKASAQRLRLKHLQDGAQAQLDLADAQLLPSVSAGYQHYWGSSLPGLVNRDSDVAFVSVRFQLGPGLSARTLQQAAAQRYTGSGFELEAFDRNLTTQVRQTVAELDAYAAQQVTLRELLSATAEVAQSYLRQYQVGRKNWLEVLNAQREMTQASYQIADIEYGLRVAAFRLLLLAGEVKAADLTAVP